MFSPDPDSMEAVLQLFEQAKQTALEESYAELERPHILGKISPIRSDTGIYDIAARVEETMRRELPLMYKVTVGVYSPNDAAALVDSLELIVQGARPKDSFIEISPLRIRETQGIN